MKQGKIIKEFHGKNRKRIIFRYPRTTDVEAMLEYANNLIDEDTTIMLSGKKIHYDEEKEYLNSMLLEMEERRAVHLIVEVERTFAGMAGVVRQKYRKTHVGLIGISLAPKFRRRGIGIELLRSVIDESRRLSLRLLVLQVFENNHRAIRLYEKIGFRTSGKVPDAYYFKNQYIGEVTMYLPLT